MRPTSVAVLMVCCIAGTGRARAQTTSAFDPLALPTGVIMCRSAPSTSNDSFAVFLEIIEGNAAQSVARTINVAYDSAGAPVFMTLVAPEEHASGRRRIHLIGLRFGVAGRSSHRVVDAPSAPSDSGTSSTHAPPRLTDAEASHARELAVWLWDHRCKPRGSEGRF